MLYDPKLSIFSPVKSPKGTSEGAGATTEGEYEDQLGEVAIDDTFTYNSDETGASCSDDDGNGKTGGGDCGKRVSATREHVKSESDEDTTTKNKIQRSDLAKDIDAEGSSSTAKLDADTSASTKDEPTKGWIGWLIAKLDGNRRDMFGGRSTRKYNRSKIARRTIRRRAERRTQKRKQKPRRTIRRERRNKKGTQKRRK